MHGVNQPTHPQQPLHLGDLGGDAGRARAQRDQAEIGDAFRWGTSGEGGGGGFGFGGGGDGGGGGEGGGGGHRGHGRWKGRMGIGMRWENFTEWSGNYYQ
jgi:hypothetical protein